MSDRTKISTKGQELGIELKDAIQRLEENLEANAPPLIIEDLSYICLYKFARLAGYDLRHNPIDPIKNNLYNIKDINNTQVKLDIKALQKFTGNVQEEEYHYY